MVRLRGDDHHLGQLLFLHLAHCLHIDRLQCPRMRIILPLLAPFLVTMCSRISLLMFIPRDPDRNAHRRVLVAAEKLNHALILIIILQSLGA